MSDLTIHLQTDQPTFDPAFLETLNHLAEQYGVRVESDIDSVRMIQEDREWLDRRDEERVAQSKGLRKDWSHLDRMKG